MVHDRAAEGYAHDHAAGANAKLLGWALLLTATYLVAEVVGRVSGVAGPHDLQVSSMSNDDVSCTVHITFAEKADADAVRRQVATVLDERFGIDHATAQAEASGEACHDDEIAHV